MKKFKKLLAITFTALLVTIIFTGCTDHNSKVSVESAYDGPVSAVIGVANTVNNFRKMVRQSHIMKLTVSAISLVIQSANIQLVSQKAIRNQNLKQICLR